MMVMKKMIHDDDSHDWVDLVDRGGLTLVNNKKFDVFVVYRI